MKNILIYPGAFNPPHLGHAAAVMTALMAKKFDELWIIPSGNRSDKVISISYEDRRNMGKLFVDYLRSKIDIPIKLITDELDDIEGRETREILKNIKIEYGDQITQLIGTDGFISLQASPINEGIFDNEKFIVVKRYGYVFPESFSSKSNILFLEREQQDISSTNIRQLISRADASYKAFLPEKIVEYIQQKKIYSQ